MVSRVQPSEEPQVGDNIEVSDLNGGWQEAKITSINNGRIGGMITDPNRANRRSGFNFSVDSYRENWRWSQKRPV